MWNTIPDDEIITKTVKSLMTNGMQAVVVSTLVEAKEHVFSLLPAGVEVMGMSSVTLNQAEISKEIEDSGKYVSVRKQLMALDRKTQSQEMQKIGAAPTWAIGSVQAITQDGVLVAVSYTGSQLPAYAYGSAHVVLVVSVQKIVENVDSAMKRINEYVLPLESERVKAAYGMEKSNVSKILLIQKEVVPNRITVILVKEDAGY